MTAFTSCLYSGTVVHKRLAPQRHAFAYKVFSLCLDVDEIDRLDRETRLFSHNRFNLLGFSDRDYAAGDGATVADQARRTLCDAGLGAFGVQISLLTYPRVLGYVFNPLSVYFCRDGGGALGAIIYEVTNTLRERVSYVLPVDAEKRLHAGPIGQACAKQMYVSPFTAMNAAYGFHVIPPADRVVVGVDLRENGRPVLKTHFSGERLPFSDRTIARLALTRPLLTFKVIAAIHAEAARLWMKGVGLADRRPSPAYAVSIADGPTREPRHV